MTNGNGGDDTLAVSGNARYVRMLGTQRGTTYGYSLYEFEIYQMPWGVTATAPALRHLVFNSNIGVRLGQVRAFSLNGMRQPVIRESENKIGGRQASGITIVQGANGKLHTSLETH